MRNDAMNGNGTVNMQKSKFFTRKTKRLVFCTLVLALPVIQLAIFYFYTHINSFILAFQEYSIPQDGSLGYDIKISLSQNFSVAWNTFTESGYMLKNSLLLYACTLLVGMTLALVFSFYIYKGFSGSGFFKVTLFLPQIVSAVVLTLLFKYISDDVYKEVYRSMTGETTLGLLMNPSTKLPTILIYNVWVGFGVNVLMFSGAMSGIDQSIVESAQLDGTTLIKEFFHITIPMIYPTFQTLVVVGMVGVFTNQMNLYTFFRDDALEVSTLGYFLYVQAQRSDVIAKEGFLSYPELSALGLICTAIILPITICTRKLMAKFGPSVN